MTAAHTRRHDLPLHSASMFAGSLCLDSLQRVGVRPDPLQMGFCLSVPPSNLCSLRDISLHKNMGYFQTSFSSTDAWQESQTCARSGGFVQLISKAVQGHGIVPSEFYFWLVISIYCVKFPSMDCFLEREREKKRNLSKLLWGGCSESLQVGPGDGS